MVPFPHEQIQSESFHIRYIQQTQGVIQNSGQVTMFDKFSPDSNPGSDGTYSKTSAR